jgi:hypothetical protein
MKEKKTKNDHEDSNQEGVHWKLVRLAARGWDLVRATKFARWLIEEGGDHLNLF